MKQKMKFLSKGKGKSTLKKGNLPKRIRTNKPPLMPSPPKKNTTDYRKPHAFDNATGAYKKNKPPSNNYTNKYIAGASIATTGYVAKKSYDKHKENKSVKGRIKKALGK